jgi:hypothetical protein
MRNNNYSVVIAGRRSLCHSWIEKNGRGEIFPDYDGCFQVRVYDVLEMDEDDGDWMDADALASAGWGTDEDYGYYGGDEW